MIKDTIDTNNLYDLCVRLILDRLEEFNQNEGLKINNELGDSMIFYGRTNENPQIIIETHQHDEPVYTHYFPDNKDPRMARMIEGFLENQTSNRILHEHISDKNLFDLLKSMKSFDGKWLSQDAIILHNWMLDDLLQAADKSISQEYRDYIQFVYKRAKNVLQYVMFILD